ncbi:polysaccharide biosynthesis protein [Bacillus sp. AGMB 02131]|uniref:Polysaccharide biosynthesis protein n=1 Tax=Peribacillus faecalis TaxID=2772559 RepID=A0A927CVU4_9BACI|nr:nucleoside-diphosphate sugar epimerase/dehydratase [Peribacillus faecalis]MBD3107697.1 polysaccharide biosynthesis protein [Peribacillus faecalis]
MKYRQRLTLFILIDTVIILITFLGSNAIVIPNHLISMHELSIMSLTLLIGHHLFAYIFNLNKKSWEYASIGELMIILKTATSTMILAAIVQVIFLNVFDERLLITIWLLHLVLIGGSRFFWRTFRDYYLLKQTNKKKTMIIGAGSAGTMVARQLIKGNASELLPVAFIDDDTKKQKLDIFGIPVVGKTKHIEHYVKMLNIEHIIIAIPSSNKEELNRIFLECAKTEAKTQILPLLEDLLTGKLSVNKIRDVQVEDLLGRQPVDLDIESISEYIKDQVILVTGAGGSIGSEICRQLCHFSPKSIILLGHGENSIYSIYMELIENYRHSGIEFITEIADIQDNKKLMEIMEKYSPEVVYHAAAHKHVPLMEKNPEEAIKNNVIGTQNVANAASWYGVKTFVMISSDKAVNPTSVMGATKRLAEMLIQEMDKNSDTKFVAVRFGNVLGSRGSVIPLFTKQIEKGGPVTVTHPDMIRYFMTIPESSRLVLQAGALADGGEIFVLDMGEPVKIVDLAKKLIKLSGYSLDEIKISFTGIRPGEKLYEELLSHDEVLEEQIYPNIYVGKTKKLFIPEIEEIIANFSNWDSDLIRHKVLLIANGQEETYPVISILN